MKRQTSQKRSFSLITMQIFKEILAEYLEHTYVQPYTVR
jgi:hypothetical protein